MFRPVKTGIIFKILLLSLFVAFIPNVSAGFINIPPLIMVTYQIPEENLIPNSGVLDIPLYTTFTLTGPFSRFIGRRGLLKDAIIQIELKVVETQDWCDASISNPLV